MRSLIFPVKGETALLVLEKPCHNEAHTPYQNLYATAETVAMRDEMPVVILSASGHNEQENIPSYHVTR